jgi:hypothetical protein
MLLLAWGYFATALRGEAPRELSRGAVRAWLESGSPLAAERLAHIAPAQRGGWLDEAAREVTGVLTRLCRKPEPGSPEEKEPESGDRPGRPSRRELASGLLCFFAAPVGPDPHRPECARCLWPRIDRCGRRAA